MMRLERGDLEGTAMFNLAQYLFENYRDIEAETILHDCIQMGIIDDPEREVYVKFYLAAIPSSSHPEKSPLPPIDATLLETKMSGLGKRSLQAFNRLDLGHKSSSHLEPKDVHLQPAPSFVTSKGSETFTESLVSHVEPSIHSVETEILTIQDVSILSTKIVHLDIDLI